MTEFINKICLLLFLILFIPVAGYGKNLHLVDQLPNGFKIYRSGVPTENDLREYSELGIEEIAVLSGDASRRESRFQRLVPDLEVVYNEKQDEKIPLTQAFLEWFDEWVTDAREDGKVIAFRCRCGCHRTGRLAAYYQMKYQGLGADAAIEIMNRLGRNMFRHPSLEPQVRALEDYIHGRPCSQEKKYCPR
jgi:protein-tyrosine phosphatase